MGKISQELRLQIMFEAGLKPLEDFANKDKPWKCECLRCGKTVSPRFGSIRQGQGGCKYCAGRIVDPQDASADLQGAGYLPMEEFPGANKPWLSKCIRCGEVSRPRLSNIKTSGSSCKFCAAVDRAAAKRKTIDDVCKIIDAAGFSVRGELEYSSNKQKLGLICKTCRKTSDKTLQSLSQKEGCGYCSRVRVDPDEAVEFMQKNGLVPLEPYRSSASSWLCKCKKCGREVSPRFSSVQSGQSGCAYCSGKKVDLDQAADLLKARSLQPLEEFPGAAKPWRCKCLKCGLEVTPRLSNLQRGHGGCLACAGKLVDPDEAANIMLGAGLLALSPYKSRHSPWKSRCLKCGREVSPTYGSISSGGGCRFCAEIGIDYTAAGYVYLITHPEMRAHKVGIANSKPRKKYYDRISQHESKGWVLVSKHEFGTADLAFAVEQEFLDWVRRVLELETYLSSKEMPQGGYTETFSGFDPVDLFVERLAQIARLQGQSAQ